MTCRDCGVELCLPNAMAMGESFMCICAPCWHGLTIPQKLVLVKSEMKRLGKGGNWAGNAARIWAGEI